MRQRHGDTNVNPPVDCDAVVGKAAVGLGHGTQAGHDGRHKIGRIGERNALGSQTTRLWASRWRITAVMSASKIVVTCGLVRLLITMCWAMARRIAVRGVSTSSGLSGAA